MLAPGIVFLNHGSFGACPTEILAKQNELRRRMEAEPVQFLWRRYEEYLEPARAAVARFVGARPRDLVFIANATTGVNSVVRSLDLQAGDELLTTDHDYNACRNVVVEAARRARARLVVVPIPFPIRSGDEVLERILRVATRRTRLAILDHVTSNSALIFPIREIIQGLAARGIDTLVDGAHAPGMVPLDVTKLGAAYYTANLHKWVCAPKGAAFLWAREDRQQGLQPAVISHGNNRTRMGFTPFQDRFDWAGTFDPTAWLCAGEAIGWMGRLLPGGWPELRRRNRALALQARRILCQRLDLDAPSRENMVGAMATLPLPGRFQKTPASGKIDPEQLLLYDKFGIEVPFLRMGRPERRFFRISAQIYNSSADYEYLADALERL
jgi:isopenicillin-N epimerase